MPRWATSSQLLGSQSLCYDKSAQLWHCLPSLAPTCGPFWAWSLKSCLFLPWPTTPTPVSSNPGPGIEGKSMASCHWSLTNSRVHVLNLCPRDLKSRWFPFWALTLGHANSRPWLPPRLFLIPPTPSTTTGASISLNIQSFMPYAFTTLWTSSLWYFCLVDSVSLGSFLSFTSVSFLQHQSFFHMVCHLLLQVLMPQFSSVVLSLSNISSVFSHLSSGDSGFVVAFSPDFKSMHCQRTLCPLESCHLWSYYTSFTYSMCLNSPPTSSHSPIFFLQSLSSLLPQFHSDHNLTEPALCCSLPLPLGQP